MSMDREIFLCSVLHWLEESKLRRREMSASSSSTFASGFGLMGCVHNSKTELIKNKKILTQLSIPDLSPLQEDKGRVTTVVSTNLSCKRREVIGFGLCLGLIDVFIGRPKEAYAAGDEEVKQCEFTVANSGLQFCERVVGFGPEAAKGQLIKAHYVGKLENGKVFDSSYNRGKPLTFRVGVGEVIKGWDLGIVGGDGVPPMLAGGKRTLRIPAELGYGARGAGCKGGSCIIPPDSVLLFDVEFIGKA